MASIRPTLASEASSEYSTDDDLMVSFPTRPRVRIHCHNPRPIDPDDLPSIPMVSKRRVSFAADGQSSEEESPESISYRNRSRSRSRGSSSSKSSESPVPSTKSSSASSDSYDSSYKNLSFELTSGEDAKSSLTSSYTSEETSERSEFTNPTQKSETVIPEAENGDSNRNKTESSNMVQFDLEAVQKDEKKQQEMKPTLILPDEEKLFFGWDDIAPSESDYGSASLASSAQHEERMELQMDFPDQERHACNASLSESQASVSTKDEPLVEDEYDPRRPWRKAPVIEVESVSGKTDTSALSSRSSGSIFIGGVTLGQSKHSAKTGKSEETAVKTNKRADLGSLIGNDIINDSKSEEGKSARSGKSSEISELRVANAALKRSGNELSGVERPTIQRHISLLSDSNFTLTTQVYRRQEPFRPGPSSLAHKSGLARSKDSTATLDKLYLTSNKDLNDMFGAPSILEEQNPTRGLALNRDTSFRSLGSVAMGASLRSLPSINETPEEISEEIKRAARMKRRIISQVKFAESERCSKRDAGVITISRPSLTHRDSGMSAITMASTRDFRTQRFHESRLRSESTLSSGDSKRSLTKEEKGQIFRSSLALGGVADIDELQDAVSSSVGASSNDREAPTNEARLELMRSTILTSNLKDANAIELQSLQSDRRSHQSLLDHNERDKLPTYEEGMQEDYIRDDYSLDSFRTGGAYSLASASDDESTTSDSGLARRTSLTRGVSFAHSRPFIRVRNCFRRKAVLITFVTIVVVATSLAVFFFFIIPRANQNRKKNKDAEKDDIDKNPYTIIDDSETVINNNGAGLYPSPDTLALDAVEFRPTPSPTVFFTFWPTPVDTYSKIYPPPN